MSTAEYHDESGAEVDEEDVVVIPVPDELSDGTEETWPLNDPRYKYRMIDDSRWRLSLAQMWVEKTGAAEEGVTYILEKMPAGYCLFDRPRSTDSQMRDPFVFGHPSRFYFQSRIQFFPHFYWLMTGRKGSCECKNCERAARGGAPHKRRTKLEIQAAKGLDPTSNGVVNHVPPVVSNALPEFDLKYPKDEEGPDYWRNLMIDLKEQKTLDKEVEQHLNLDWALTHESLEDMFVRLTLQGAYIPRRGEVVLWTPFLDGALEYNYQAKCVMVRDEDGEWKGIPKWRAGVVTQTPEERCNFMDICQLTKKQEDDVTSYGFRVETLPDPLGEDKSYSLQHKYVPLKNIKPFAAFEPFLTSFAREELHPSIENAMTTMASFSMLHFYRFEGNWPDAKLYTKGIWLGHELLAVKDVVRLMPPGLTPQNMDGKFTRYNDQIRVTDVMVIEKIYIEMKQCTDDPKDPQYAQSYEVCIAGKVYTLDRERLNRPCDFGNDKLTRMSDHEVDTSFNVVGMQGYGDWYRVASGRTCVVFKDNILGRCYEPDAAYLAFRTLDLGYDLHGVLDGRRYSAQADGRMAEGSTWFWGDFRVETLGLSTVNGADCGPSAEERQDMPRWQAVLRIVNDCPSARDIRVAFEDPPETEGDSRSLSVAFAALGKTSSLVSSGLGHMHTARDFEVKEESDAGESDGNESEPSSSVLSGVGLPTPLPFREVVEEDYAESSSEVEDDGE